MGACSTTGGGAARARQTVPNDMLHSHGANECHRTFEGTQASMQPPMHPCSSQTPPTSRSPPRSQVSDTRSVWREDSWHTGDQGKVAQTAVGAEYREPPLKRNMPVWRRPFDTVVLIITCIPSVWSSLVRHGARRAPPIPLRVVTLSSRLLCLDVIHPPNQPRV